MRYSLFSDYTTSPRADAVAALRQLREAKLAGSDLRKLYRGMAIAEAKLERLGESFATAAQRMNSYAPPSVTELDEMLARLEEPAKASCPDCEGFGRCSACDGRGVVFTARAA